MWRVKPLEESKPVVRRVALDIRYPNDSPLFIDGMTNEAKTELEVHFVVAKKPEETPREALLRVARDIVARG